MQPAFFVVADGQSYPKLATTAHENRVFHNQMKGGANAGTTWSIRLRQYGLAGGGTNDAVPTPHTQSATLDKARGSDGTRSPHKKD